METLAGTSHSNVAYFPKFFSEAEMNCELAQELKDAGFPFRVVGQSSQTDRIIHSGEQITYEQPTLSELIDACNSRSNFDLHRRQETWFAHLDGSMGIGVSAEEAVVRLWLALKKRHE